MVFATAQPFSSADFCCCDAHTFHNRPAGLLPTSTSASFSTDPAGVHQRERKYFSPTQKPTKREAKASVAGPVLRCMCILISYISTPFPCMCILLRRTDSLNQYLNRIESSRWWESMWESLLLSRLSRSLRKERKRTFRVRHSYP